MTYQPFRPRWRGASRDVAAALDRLSSVPALLDDWPRRIEAARVFAARWDAQARALGWSETDLYGLHPQAPTTRRDARGLAWCLAGGEHVTALTADAAVVETRTGARLRFYRPSGDTGSVVAWELAQGGGQ